MKSFGMFTAEGNQLVARIAAAGEKLAAADGAENAWRFAQRELSKLSRGSFMKDGVENTFGEATDTDVRERVYDVVVAAAEDDCNFYL